MALLHAVGLISSTGRSLMVAKNIWGYGSVVPPEEARKIAIHKLYKLERGIMGSGKIPTPDNMLSAIYTRFFSPLTLTIVHVFTRIIT